MSSSTLTSGLIASSFLLVATGCGGTVVFEEGRGQGDGGGGSDATSGQGASTSGSGSSTVTTTTGSPTVTTGGGTSDRPTPEELCDFFCACAGCGSVQLQDCTDSAVDYYDDAARAGCDAQLDEYLTCFFDELECVSGTPILEECTDILAALNDCLE